MGAASSRPLHLYAVVPRGSEASQEPHGDAQGLLLLCVRTIDRGTG